MRIIVALGARPNVVKVGPLLPELARAGIECDVAFTGSRGAPHDDDSAEGLSFYGVDLITPRWFLDIGTGTHAMETGKAMVAFEGLFGRERPDAALVVGDVSATLAAAVSAVKAGVPVIHLDAGLRCGDLRVPEEVNRVLVSRIASLHLTPTERALENLEDEGVEPERVHFVGSILAESVIRHLDAIAGIDVAGAYGLVTNGYALGCFHRPENLADPARLSAILEGLAALPLPVLVPDTNGLRAAMAEAGLQAAGAVSVVDAVPYRSMLALERDAAVVLTDSTGVQEEACSICTPCITVRDCTEQVATVEAGANRLVSADSDAIIESVANILAEPPTWVVPKRWDRAVSDRIVRAIKRGVAPLV
ncbi:MAG: UDP-N-acetylglucosamine 2-epimerase (non-hydrolyzing) [Coriobacteriia bacterium]|nr:UDP-N-acetylglucosamine 2-epimerase (non-hydrolyzing) [Coriobacteriia bacterium]